MVRLWPPDDGRHSGHARPADPQGDESRADARLRHRPADRAGLRGVFKVNPGSLLVGCSGSSARVSCRANGGRPRTARRARYYRSPAGAEATRRRNSEWERRAGGDRAAAEGRGLLDIAIWRPLTRGLRALVGRTAANRELANEIAALSSNRRPTRSWRAALPPDEARRAARLELGSATVVTRGGARLRMGATSVGIAARRSALRRAPAARRVRASPLVSVLTLALGIGAHARRSSAPSTRSCSSRCRIRRPAA